MKKHDISIIIEGEDINAEAEKIKDIIQNELKYGAQVLPNNASLSNENTKSFDPISLTSLIIVIPSAILAIADIAERIQTKKKLDRTLEAIQKQAANKKQITIKIRYPDGMIKEISTVESVEILETIPKKRKND